MLRRRGGGAFDRHLVWAAYWFHQQASYFWLLSGFEFTWRDFMVHSSAPCNL